MGNRITEYMDKWIFREYTVPAAGLPIFRVVYGLIALIVFFPRHLWISHHPDVFFFPRVSMTIFFSGFPDMWFFVLLNFIMIGSALALILGYRVFWASLLLAAALLTGNSFAYSFGKINHDIFIILIPLVLAFSNWGDRLKTGNWNKQNSPGKDTGRWHDLKQTGWPLALLAMLVSLGMLTAAIPKITSGWLDPSVSALMGHLARNYHITERSTFLAEFFLVHNNLAFFKLLDYSTLVLEAGFMIAMFRWRWFLTFCAAACLFHFGVLLMMGITFVNNVIAYAAFVPWLYFLKGGTMEKAVIYLDRMREKVNLIRLLLITLPVWAILVFVSHPLQFSHPWISYYLGGALHSVVILTVSAGISLVYLLSLITRKRPAAPPY
jgi:hypothetical protein